LQKERKGDREIKKTVKKRVDKIQRIRERKAFPGGQ